MESSFLKRPLFNQRLIRNYETNIGEYSQSAIERKIEMWEMESYKHALIDYPYHELESLYRKICDHKQNSNTRIDLVDDIEHISQITKGFQVPFDVGYWKDRISMDELVEDKSFIMADVTPLNNLLERNFNEYIQQLVCDWNNKYFLEKENEFAKTLNKWFKQYLYIRTTLKNLSLDSDDTDFFSAGLLWDNCESDLSEADFEAVSRYFSFLKDNKEVQKLCDLMGRLNDEKKRGEKNTFFVTNHYLPDNHNYNSKQEIVGITLGRDLENVVPSEFALLADDELSILFDLKFIEQKLLCFDLQKIAMIQKENTRVTEELVVDEKGPIIICVDTSGSMAGDAEDLAKAIALVLVNRALTQDRECTVILFSDTIESKTYDKNTGLASIIDFLKMSFQGGSPSMPAVKHVLGLLESNNYRNADMLMISDFELEPLSAKEIKKITQAKNNGNKFYSLTINDYDNQNPLNNIFDKEWVYDLDKKDISIINKLNDAVLFR